MYNDSRLYELSFVPPRRRPKTKPCIVFTINTEHLEELSRRLHIIAPQWDLHADEYCSPETPFCHLVPDLFGRMEFGYWACGLVVIESGRAHLRIELDRKKLHCATLTIKLLTQALAVPIDEAKSNQRQQVDLETRCEYDSRGYSHAVGGWMSSEVTSWLRSQARAGKDVPVPPEVLSAMRFTWSSVVKKDSQQWAGECRGRISADGRFMLECFGNACDIAIYPDGTCGRLEDDQVRFSCHNLDTAAQQVTLLAGLAKLCELARKDG